MPRQQHLAWIVSCSGLLLILTGCGVKSYPVRGAVAFADGKSLSGGTVVFELVHDDARERLSYSAEIGKDGKFRLEAPPGDYRVMIAPATPTLGGVEGSSRVWAFDEKFGDFESSGLRFSVKNAEASNHFMITVTPP